MPAYTEDELFAAPAAGGSKISAVSENELFADNWPAEPPADKAKPQLGARPTPQQMEGYVSWRDTHDDFGRPTATKPGPRREYAATSPGGQFFEDVAHNTFDASVTVTDMVLGAPGQLAAVGRNASARLQAYFKDPSLDRRTIAGIGAIAQQEVPAAFTAPIKTLTDRLRRGEASLEAPPEDLISTGMGAVGEGIKSGARKLQTATGGAVIEEDTQFLADSGMALLGMKGLTAPLGRGSGLKLTNPKGVNEHFRNQDRRTETIDPREGPAPTPEQADNYFKTYNEVKAVETDLGRSDARTNAEQQAYDLMQKGASKATVESIVKRNPLVGEAMAAIRSRRAMASESGLGRVLQGEVLDPETGLKPDGGTPDFGDPAAPRPGTGREVAPTPGEPVAAAANRNPLWLGAAGLAGTGLALSLAYPEQRDEALASAGLAGALVIGKNRGLSLADIRALPDSAPLGHILNNSAYTLKALDRLPRGKTTFGVQEILDQAKRSDIGDAEKTLIRDALDLSTGDGKTITAKELVANIKELAEHQELKGADSHGENYSEYGLERIDRNPKSVGDDVDPWNIWEDGPSSRAEIEKMQGSAVEDITTLWKAPKLEFNGSHFTDSDVFGHTRSFLQDGIRHVVEVQSDFAQKGMKKVDPKALESAREALPRNREQIALFDQRDPNINVEGYAVEAQKLLNKLQKINPDVRMMVGENLKRDNSHYFPEGADPEVVLEHFLATAADDVSARGIPARREISKALSAYRGRVEQLIDQQVFDLRQHAQQIRYSGMVKTWPKRLVREELARGATPKLNPEWVKEATALQRAQKVLDDRISMAEEGGLREKEFTAAAREDVDFFRGRLAEVPKNLPPEPYVRFATADTVAKVEGWATDLRGARERATDAVIRAEDYIGDLRLTLRNASSTAMAKADAQSLLPVAEKELQAAKEKLAELSKPDARVPFLDPAHQGLYDRHAKEVDKFNLSLGGKPYTDASGHTWIEVPTKPFAGPTQMYGRTTSEFQMLLGGAAAGAIAGAYLANPDNKFIGASLGLALGAALARPGTLKGLSQSAENALGAPSTNILNQSPPILRRAYQREQLWRKHSYEAITAAEPLRKDLASLPKAQREALEIAILDNSPEKIKAAIAATGRPEIATSLAAAMKMQQDLGQQLVKLGIVSSLRPNYFHRSVRDYPGLAAHLGKEVGGRLEEAVAAADKRAFNKRGYGLSQAERDIVTNNFLQGREVMGGKKGFAKERKLDEVTAETRPFYDDPVAGLHSYIESATKAIETARLFGKDLKLAVGDGQTTFDLQKSIGALINRELDAGRLTREGADIVENNLRAVLLDGEKAAHKYLQDARSIINSSLLGNPVSAVGQFAEIGSIAFLQGILPTIRAAGRRLTGRGTVNVRDTGIIEHAAMEFSGERPLAKVVKKQFELSGFTASDISMKNLALEARAIRYSQLNNPKKAQAFREKYEAFFGDDFPKVLDDLKSGRTTPLTDEVAWYELAQNQPTSNLEIPMSLLRNPNGRIVASLKTFMLKQMDVVRRTAWKEMREGKPLKATATLSRYALLLGVAGVPVAAIQAIMLNRAPEGYSLGNILSAAAKTFMWSNYMVDQAEKKGPMALAWENVLKPPVAVFDDLIFSRFKNPPTEREQEKLDREFMKKVPGVGKLYEAWAMGGGELADEGRAKAESKKVSRQAIKDRAEEAGHPLSADEIKAIRQEIRERKQLQGARP
jgi:hypothetical protein